MMTQRIYIGCPLTASWKMHTNTSSYWKEMQLLPAKKRDLTIVNHKGKQFIAQFVSESETPLTRKEIHAITSAFRTKLTKITEQEDSSKVPVFIFTQLFVA